MNKQEVIESLEKKRERALDNFEYYRDKENEKYETMNRVRVDSYTIAIQAVEQIDEPQAEKVEVPGFIDKLIRKYKAKKETLVCSIENLYRESDEYKWYVDNAEIYERAWVNGYTIKPKRWVVRLDNGRYVNDFQEAKFCIGIGITLEMDCLPPFKFTDKSKAEAVATLVEGTVEEV